VAQRATRALARDPSLVTRHLPEYLIEAFLLGMFMVSAGVVGTLLGAPASPLVHSIPNESVRAVMGGLAMGLTAIALIYSGWGKRSGAHMNPAVTLAFVRLGKVRWPDAIGYIAAQVVGGTAGVVLVHTAFGDAFASAPVQYVATLPMKGLLAAFIAEFAISFVMMTIVLRATSSSRWMKYTGVFAGLLVATYIIFEAPYSGMSMNPARTFASALPSGIWTGFWIYLTAPVLAMQVAVSVNRFTSVRSSGCAKLLHFDAQRCIFCGHAPRKSEEKGFTRRTRSAGEKGLAENKRSKDPNRKRHLTQSSQSAQRCEMRSGLPTQSASLPRRGYLANARLPKFGLPLMKLRTHSLERLADEHLKL
jgi:aquaporin Z